MCKVLGVTNAKLVTLASPVPVPKDASLVSAPDSLIPAPLHHTTEALSVLIVVLIALLSLPMKLTLSSTLRDHKVWLMKLLEESPSVKAPIVVFSGVFQHVSKEIG